MRSIGRISAAAVLASLGFGCAGLTIPQPAPNQAMGWLLRVGPQGGHQRVACASDRPGPCVLEHAASPERIESTLVLYLPPTNHHYNGEAITTFIGGDEGPDGYTMQIDQDVKDIGYPQASATGLLTTAPGPHRIRITLDESGPDLHEPVRHVIDVPVEVK